MLPRSADSNPFGMPVLPDETDVSAALRKFLELLDHSPAFAAYLVGEDLRFEYSNHAHNRLIGERPLIGKPLCEAVPEAKAIGLADGMAGVLNSGEPFAVSGLPLDLATGCRVVDVLIQPVKDKKGQVIGVFANGVDRTEG